MAKHDNDVETESPCSDGLQIIYAWAKDAPKLELPEGVGFKVGKNSPIKYLVLQVHYAHMEQFKGSLKLYCFILFLIFLVFFTVHVKLQ